MAYESFGEFVEALDRAGELLRIAAPVATELEITALADLEMKAPGGGRALLFEKPTVNGRVSPLPVAVNTMGSWKRMAMSLQAESVDAAAAQMGALLHAKPPGSIAETLKLLGAAFELRHARPKLVSGGPCKEVIHRFEEAAGQGRAVQWPPAPDWTRPETVNARPPTLLDLPVLKCWPLDGGRFLTLPCVVTEDPLTGARNVGMYRVQIYDERTTGMHWQLQKVGARHGRHYYETGARMPVAVFLGGDPVYAFCATAPLPDGVDEFLLAGYLRRKSVELVKCETSDLRVPANADIVIEGYIDPLEPLRQEGPFGDHTGFYTLPEPYPALHVTAVTRRRNAVYPATIVGPPPMEDFYMGGASVKLFMPVFKMTFPELVDLALPAEGVFHNLVFVSIKKTYPMQAYKIMHGLWGMGQMMFAKYVVVVDDDVNVHDTREVLFRWCANTDPQRDALLSRGPADVLDHATSVPGAGGKMGFDATRKLPAEGYPRQWPPLARMDSETTRRMEALMAGLGRR